MKLKLTLEYAGEEFSGWQRQDGLVTVQGSLEEALGVIIQSEYKKCSLENMPIEVSVTGSGRTDSGVHARGQVASFEYPDNLPLHESRLKQALNALTPKGLSIRAVERVSERFNARHAPHIKCYTYRIIYKGEEPYGSRLAPLDHKLGWCVVKKLDIAKMISAARIIEGQHDFESFRAKDCSAKSTIRSVLRSELVRVGDQELLYFVHGKGFLKQMIRILVGTLVELGANSLGAQRMREILIARDRLQAGRTAPAQGLTLEWVKYSE